MSKIKFPALCLLLAGTAGAHVAQAALPTGLYIGINGGQAEVRESCDNLANCDSADNSVRAELGYQINTNLAAELGYTSFGTLFNAAFSATNNTVNAKQEAHAWTASVLGLWPVAPQFDIFGRIGVARYDVTNTGTVQGKVLEDDESTKPYYGIGVKYDLNNSWLVRAEYQIYSDISGVRGSNDNIHAWYLGGAYRF